VGKTVEDLGDRGFASDGLETDDKGRIYLTEAVEFTLGSRPGARRCGAVRMGKWKVVVGW
jgi:hypothetical protein